MRNTLIIALTLLPLTRPPLAQGHQHGAPGAAPSVAAERLARVRLSTGVELEVTERGRPDGHPVLFLHGFTDSRHSFETVAAHLPPDFRAILPSQRGHGDSERPACCYQLGDFAADAVALLDALGIARATVVGHSLGSFIAQRVASDHPDRVHRLVLIGTGHSGRVPPVLEFNDVVQGLPDPVPADFVREFQQGSAALPVDPAFLQRAIAESSKLPARVWKETLAGLVSLTTAADLSRITAPTLLIWGDKDPLFNHASQDTLRRAVNGARLVTYETVGHSPNWELPARVAADLVAFVQGASPQRAGTQRQGASPAARRRAPQ